ncbi:HD-GYP domain-containing protein [Roseibium sp.]|uniref:HD-GYP domain-containing protein n=1 Tax=Roseibium sp. TaxID=1936156 RepID=UPI003D0FF4A8
MEIVLISDGPLPDGSPVRKLPLYYRARLVDMAKVTPKTVGSARIAIIELQGSSDTGLTALKASWEEITEVPFICVVDRTKRREVIQARALGDSDPIDRNAPFAVLLRRIRTLAGPDLRAALPKDTSAQTAEAYVKGCTFLESLCLSATEGMNIQVNLMTHSATDILNALSLDGLSAWLNAVQTHHSATYSHSLMVAGLAGHFAMKLGWPEDACKEVIAGGLVHDIGKTRIPLTILDKAGELTEDERRIVRKHPMLGREILKPRLELSLDLKKMAIQHHEYLDGSGYPDGLKAARISAKVRLITICDIFAALTEQRPYKDVMPARVALAVMRKMGPKLDQNMLSRFAAAVLPDELGHLNRAPGDGEAA